MGNQKCPECGNLLTQEMIDVNMCWECGKILDDSLLDLESKEKIKNQKEEIEKQKHEAEERNREYELLNNLEVKKHKLTTGYNFEGYKILNYIGLVSGEVVSGTGVVSDIMASCSDFFGIESKSYSNKLKEAKKIALYNMIRESINMGGNAIIGISYGYINFTGNMIGISVNGTSVIIEDKES